LESELGASALHPKKIDISIIFYRRFSGKGSLFFVMGKIFPTVGRARTAF
jgi:hypothetical protein